MECNREPVLTEGFDFSCLAQQLRSGWNQEVLAVMRKNIVGKQAFDGPGELPVEPVDEGGFEYGSFK